MLKAKACSPALLLMFSYPVPRPHCTEIHLSWGFAEAVSVCEEPGLSYMWA